MSILDKNLLETCTFKNTRAQLLSYQYSGIIYASFTLSTLNDLARITTQLDEIEAAKLIATLHQHICNIALMKLEIDEAKQVTETL